MAKALGVKPLGWAGIVAPAMQEQIEPGKEMRRGESKLHPLSG